MLQEMKPTDGDLLLGREPLAGLFGHGEPPLEVVAYSSRRLVPFQLRQNRSADIVRSRLSERPDRAAGPLERTPR